MTVEQLPLEVQEISKTLVLAPFSFKICKPTTNPAPQLPILYLHTVWPLEAKLCAENRLMFQLNTYCNYRYKFCYLWCLVCCKCHLLNQWPEAQYYRLVTSPRNSCQCVRYFLRRLLFPQNCSVHYFGFLQVSVDISGNTSTIQLLVCVLAIYASNW